MAGRILDIWRGVLTLCGACILVAGCPMPPTGNANNPAGVTLARSAPTEYSPGETIQIQITIRATDGDSISAIGLSELIPAGWTFVSASGPAIVPATGATGTLDFAWVAPPTFPYTFTYQVLAPNDARGPVEISGSIEYRQDAGPYTTTAVVSSLEAINPAGVVLGRSHASTYTPGGALTVTIDIDAESDGTVTAIGLAETIPDGWALESVGPGDGVPDVSPEAGTGGLLEFVWITIPEFPYTFNYVLSVPPDAAGTAEISGHVEYREDGGPLSTEDLVSTLDAAVP